MFTLLPFFLLVILGRAGRKWVTVTDTPPARSLDDRARLKKRGIVSALGFAHGKTALMLFSVT